MLFNIVTRVLCWGGIENPAKLRPDWHTTWGTTVSAASVPPAFTGWNDSIQTKTNCFYAASALLCERISNDPGIAHSFPCPNSGAIQLAASIAKGGITAYAIYF